MLADSLEPSIRKIIHVDMDAFYASVEQRDNPQYKGKPVVVGGSPHQRGVVCAASYEARQFGIHSAMPSRTAIQRCPQVVFLSPRFDVYRAVSEQVREIFHRYTDLVEPLSLDEAYLDVTENKASVPSATIIAKEIRKDILDETGLTASAGISINKFLAKTASGMNKPDGLFLIPPDRATTFLEDLAIDKFYGIGAVTAEKMRRAGIHTGADLKRWTEENLVNRFGKMGSHYFRIVRGQDDRPVNPNHIAKSIGCEESFAKDLVDRDSMIEALKEIADTLKRRIDHHGSSGRTLTLKVKYADYKQVTRSRTFIHAIVDVEQMMEVALELLATTEVLEKHARLLGLAVSNLETDEEEESEYIQLTLDLVLAS